MKQLSVEEKKTLERNITLNYIIGSLMWGRFFIPVLALFYIASQVPLEQFAIIMAAFTLTTVLLEIPTGVLADLIGKKKTLLLSRFLYIIEIVILAFFNGFWPFLIAKVISGAGVSLSSGTSSALLYDSLKRLNRTREHKRISGIFYAITNVSMAFTFIIGAYMFALSPKLPALVSLPIIALGFFLTFLLREPYPPRRRLTLHRSWKHLKKGMSLFWRNHYLLYLGLLAFVVEAGINISQSFSSVYLEAIFIPVDLIGVVAFIASLLTAFAARRAHALEAHWGERRSLFMLQLFIVLGILLMSFLVPYIGIIFYLIIALAYGFLSVIMNDYTNRHAHTPHRATMLSISNMFGNFGVALLFPAVGHLTKAYSLGLSYLYFSALITLWLIVAWVVFRKRITAQGVS